MDGKGDQMPCDTAVPHLNFFQNLRRKVEKIPARKKEKCHQRKLVYVVTVDSESEGERVRIREREE